MNNLGVCYLLGDKNGDGNTSLVDHSKAVYWFEKAVKSNYSPAYNNYGVYLEHGFGLPD